MQIFRRLLCAAFAFALLGTTAGAQTSADARLAALAHQYYYENFALHPIDATQAGLHTYDAQVGDFSAGAFERDLLRDRLYLTRLSLIDRRALSAEGAVDAQIFENALRDDELLNGTLVQWRHNPDIYSQAATGAIFSIITRAYAPLDVRARYVIARERALPSILDSGRKNLISVDATTKSIAYDDTIGSASFFTSTVPLAFAGLHDRALRAQLRAANAGAQRAMSAYAAWIKALHPRGSFAIGARAYQERLRYEDGVDLTLAQYQAVGERELARLRAQYIATAREIDPQKPPFAVYQEISKDHPAAHQLLAAAAGDLVKLRAFIVAKRIITLPPDANINVVETPPFERATTSASFDAPGPLETVATQTYYNVTPVDPSWPKAEQEEYLESLSNWERPVGYSAHECYPGHFVNYAIDKHLHLSLIRKLNWNQAFGEGWAHYDEQMVVDEGWGNGNPRVRLAQLEEALLRAGRYIVGLKLHTQGMTVAQAEDFFVDQAFQSRQTAVEETMRGTQDPMYGYYTLGKLMILKLRADYQKKLGSAYTLGGFHDALLAHGDPPVPLVRKLLLGSADDGKIL